MFNITYNKRNTYWNYTEIPFSSIESPESRNPSQVSRKQSDKGEPRGVLKTIGLHPSNVSRNARKR